MMQQGAAPAGEVWRRRVAAVERGLGAAEQEGWRSSTLRRGKAGWDGGAQRPVALDLVGMQSRRGSTRLPVREERMHTMNSSAADGGVPRADEAAGGRRLEAGRPERQPVVLYAGRWGR